ncbi:four-carbon acid sugar kinase family protein [Thermoflavimicrobium daqui]|jgi:uncharacterized protein YgbK (DUF1537 family)|uniref:Hydroxyacid dehydrogenase n=1 Tax=Thermoflavimicrobium daqui TaxID=2137476 RepID=A0A364K7C8_9BACL|nr:four-carbon acid sugar kinase family protein [Thermoflavimicrobium daqui]RAL26205.1 hydroxyacid dehydrogenase [Thermoflavimicrobium daqui]
MNDVSKLWKDIPPLLKIVGARRQIQDWWVKQRHKIVVLDDDPTGVQTVHDVSVITDWSKQWILKALQEDNHLFYILTNTRSMEPDQAEQINREIICQLVECAQELKISFSVISRSDSTLRGHYPLEIDVIQEEIERKNGMSMDGHLIIPAFFEGKRYTIRNTHYLLEEETLVPVHDTEFAKDTVFGYQTGVLPDWIQEKRGAVTKTPIHVISLEDIRLGGIDRVCKILCSVENHAPIVVNAVAYEDLEVVSLALINAWEQGKNFLYRTAASFVKAFAGLEDRPLLTGEEMINTAGREHGGLIVVGSHTRKTTEQLQHLVQEQKVNIVEIDVTKLLNQENRHQEIARVTEEMNRFIKQGINTVVYTSRDVIIAPEKLRNLDISQTISHSLSTLVNHLSVSPQFIIAKGGITSSDIATDGLCIKKAKVLGQVVSGIPVWFTGSESRFPYTPYVVFPGNVGERGTLSEIVAKIQNIKEGS